MLIQQASHRCSLSVPRQSKQKVSQTRYREDIFYKEGDETLAQVAQRGGRCPIPGSIQGQVGWGSEQPDLVEDVPAGL